MEKDGRKITEAANGAAWRSWLAENHDQEPGVWLVIYKMDSGIPSVYYDEAVDEALCHGWVDSKPNKRDDKSYFQYFSPRKPKSNWSRVNKEKIERLDKEGRLAGPGRAMVELAKQTGTWDALNEVEALIVPDDLALELDRYPQARKYWEGFPPSTQRGILEWIFNAKRAPTRAARIAETAKLADADIRANQYRQPKKNKK